MYAIHYRRFIHMQDKDVVQSGSALEGKHILLGVSGGIAAVDSVRIARELRRNGAKLTVCMTNSAQRVITKHALEWATDGVVITDWDSDMGQLQEFDGILICPATKNIISSHINGIMSSPLLMALSAARSRDTPILFVPSMHSDLSNDPVTQESTNALIEQGAYVLWGDEDEGKMKNPNHVEIVAELSHHINSRRENRKSIVITLGATRSRLDDVRYIQNTSSGKTGWSIAEDLHLHGHDVSVVSGVTTVSPTFPLPLVINADDPKMMLEELKALSKDQIDIWIHSAAVLDYVVSSPVEGKIASLQGELNVVLTEAEKHVKELSEMVNGATRIGFKLECGVKISDLVHRALALLKNSDLDIVIANRLEDINDPKKPRAHLVDSNGEHWALEDNLKLVDAVRVIVER